MIHVVIDNLNRLSGELSEDEWQIDSANTRIFIGKSLCFKLINHKLKLLELII